MWADDVQWGKSTIHTSTDECLCDKEDAKKYVEVANACLLLMTNDYYNQGNRNDLILDLYVSVYMLGLNINNVLKHHSLYDRLDARDDEHVSDRIRRMGRYEERFDWYYMQSPNHWLYCAENMRVRGRTAEIEIVLD